MINKDKSLSIRPIAGAKYMVFYHCKHCAHTGQLVVEPSQLELVMDGAELHVECSTCKKPWMMKVVDEEFANIAIYTKKRYIPPARKRVSNKPSLTLEEQLSMARKRVTKEEPALVASSNLEKSRDLFISKKSRLNAPLSGRMRAMLADADINKRKPYKK